MTDMVPCSEPHLAEVVTRTSADALVPSGRGQPPQRPNLAACATTAYEHLGTPRWIPAAIDQPFSDRGGPHSRPRSRRCGPGRCRVKAAKGGGHASWSRHRASAPARQDCSPARRRGRTRSHCANGELRVAVVVMQNPDDVAREGWGPGRGGPNRAACTIGTSSGGCSTGRSPGWQERRSPGRKHRQQRCPRPVQGARGAGSRVPGGRGLSCKGPSALPRPA